MTDDEQDQWDVDDLTEEQKEEYAQALRAAQPDAMLSVLASISGVPITLTVGGCLVSGYTATRLAWLDGLIDHLGESAASVVIWRDEWKEIQDKLDKPVSGEAPPVERFVYLTETQWFGGLSNPVGQNFWRGRLTEVQGWSYGRLAP